MINEICDINHFEICEYEQTDFLMLFGTFQYVPCGLRLYASIQGQRYDTHACMIPMEHAKNEVKHQLEVEWKLPEKAGDTIHFFLVDEQSKEIELFSFTSTEIKEHTINTSIISCIQTVSFEEKIGTMIGWAFSLGKGPITYEISDELGKIIECSLRRTLQQRLNDRNAVSKDEMLCGFILSFEGNEEHSYQLNLTDGINKATIPLDSYVQENQANAGKMIRLFHMINQKNIERGILYIRKNGINGFLKRLTKPISEEMDYDAWFHRNRVSQIDLQKEKEHAFAYAPKISLIVPVFNTPKDLLEEMIQSVLHQSYANWQLCIADGSDENSDARRIVTEYSANDPRIKAEFLTENYGISGNTNHALKMADGEYTALFDHDDVLEPDALYEIVKSLQEVQHDIIYTDEDKLNDRTGQFEDPNFKPDYDKDLLLSHNYITHFFSVKTQIIKEIGGFDSQFDGSQDYDVILRCIEHAKSIHHIAKSLYHWRMHEGSTALDPESKMYCYVAGQNAIQAHLDRIGIKAKVEMQPKPLFGLYHVIYEVPHALVSIIIPNMDHSQVLKTCIDSLFHISQFQDFEVIVVENNSREQETFAYYDTLQKEHENVRVVTWKEKEFNYSAINNYGESFAKGEYLLFLNNDTEMIGHDAISEMIGLCAREDVGAVGAKLLYQDNTIQHAGVIVGFSGYAGHVFNDIPNGKDYGYMTRDVLNGDLSAVTAACMMTKKAVFEEVHGFDEQFKIACNDIDYCLKIRKTGKLVAYNAFSLWHHYESKSRGYENSFEKTVRFDDEVARWQKKWMDVLLEGDPYYNRNFKVEDGPFILK
jgi:GT2 family glycosyltransferase